MLLNSDQKNVNTGSDTAISRPGIYKLKGTILQPVPSLSNGECQYPGISENSEDASDLVHQFCIS